MVDNEVTARVVTDCPMGTYITLPPTPSSDRYCTQCLPGWYSDQLNMLDCTRWTTGCGDYIQSMGPTNVTDRLCDVQLRTDLDGGSTASTTPSSLDTNGSNSSASDGTDNSSSTVIAVVVVVLVLILVAFGVGLYMRSRHAQMAEGSQNVYENSLFMPALGRAEVIAFDVDSGPLRPFNVETIDLPSGTKVTIGGVTNAVLSREEREAVLQETNAYVGKFVICSADKGKHGVGAYAHTQLTGKSMNPVHNSVQPTSEFGTGYTFKRSVYASLDAVVNASWMAVNPDNKYQASGPARSVSGGLGPVALEESFMLPSGTKVEICGVTEYVLTRQEREAALLGRESYPGKFLICRADERKHGVGTYVHSELIGTSFVHSSIKVASDGAGFTFAGAVFPSVGAIADTYWEKASPSATDVDDGYLEVGADARQLTDNTSADMLDE